MNRLVAVSNRVGPVRGAAAAGGLAVALVEALREHGGLWFGWSGKTLARESPTVHRKMVDGVELAQIDLARDEYESYYNGFSNLCLWPLLHFRIDLTHFEPRHFEAYGRVNRQFAAALRPLLKPGDLVWVHDYHLFPLGSALRSLGTHHRLGFFLHVPFPPADLLVTLPCHSQIVAALFDYDLAGFQTGPDLLRFCDYIERIAGGRVVRGVAHAFGRSLAVRAFPIGIDADKFSELARSISAQREYRRVNHALRDRAQIIGVDRLDYTKGLLRRLAAYESLLDHYPDARSRIEFLQIAPISRGELRAYREFRRELELAAARINGRFATVDWTPVRYLNRALPRSTLAGLYRASRIGLVTPMRDGMNLVAKEYVAAQDPRDPGVLVLSRFAGAAQQLQAALLVNPYDAGEMTLALEAARGMGIEERRNRHAELIKAVRAHDVARWREDFVDCLRSVRSDRRRLRRPHTPQAGGGSPAPTAPSMQDRHDAAANAAEVDWAPVKFQRAGGF